MNDQGLIEGTAPLLHAGLTETQIRALLRLRHRLEQDRRAEQAGELKRLKFARWCVEHDLLHK